MATAMGMAQPLAIRPAEIADAAAIQAIYAPIVAQTPISFEIEPPTVAEMAGRIAAIRQRYPYFVATRGETVMGYAYASEHRSRAAYSISVDVTAYVAEAARRQGVGRALYGALIAALGEAGFHSAHAGITLPNAASVALHEAMGFEKVGVYREVGYKLGAYHSVGWWQRML